MVRNAIDISTPAGIEQWRRQFIARKMSRLNAAMETVAWRIIDDCIFEVPMCPVLSGSLACSGSVFKDGELVATSGSMITQVGGTPTKEHPFNPTPLLMLPDMSGINKRTLTVVFNKPYARKLHESPHFHFKRPGTGAFWVISKLINNNESYKNIIQNIIRG